MFDQYSNSSRNHSHHSSSQKIKDQKSRSFDRDDDELDVSALFKNEKKRFTINNVKEISKLANFREKEFIRKHITKRETAKRIEASALNLEKRTNSHDVLGGSVQIKSNKRRNGLKENPFGSNSRNFTSNFDYEMDIL